MTMVNESVESAVPAKVTEGFGMTALERSAELASKAVEAAAKAEVESAYVMAIRNPRNVEDARAMIVKTCAIPSFAAKAKYRKKVGSKPDGRGGWADEFAVGPSIRFAEAMLLAWRNVLCQQTTIFDDPMKRIVKVRVVDLETNVNYSKEITLEKQVERKSSKDREVLSKRLNSRNEPVYLVKSTEDELVNKEAAHASKTIRNNGLRLIPTWILEDAMKAVDDTLAKKITENPDLERNALIDGFTRRGVLPSDLEKYLGVPVPQWGVKDLMALREILTSLEDGQASWAEYVEAGPTEVQASISRQSQPETQGARLVEAQQSGGEPVGSQKPAVGPQSEAEKREKLQQWTATILTLKGGDAVLRGLKIPPSGVPAENLDFVLNQLEQGIERLKAAAKR